MIIPPCERGLAMAAGQKDAARPYGLADFHEKHRYLSHAEATRIIAETQGNRERADAAAEGVRRG